MSELQSLRFGFHRILTDQFAVIDEIFMPGPVANVYNNLEYSFNNDERTIKVKGDFSFQQEGKTFIKLSVSCFFIIHEDDWKQIFDASQSRFFLPRNPAMHLGSLVVSLARGILHAKLESQPFHYLILPPVNLQEILMSDIEVIKKPDGLEQV